MRCRAFTLLEVLVSSAVLAIVLAVMFAALSTSLALWRNTDSKIVADREARAVEMMLVRDLANVVVPPPTTLWPQITTSGDGVSQLKFLTLAPSEYQPGSSTNVGDVCYVEYAVLPSTNGPGREMRRLFWPSQKTFSEILTKTNFPTNSVSSPDYQSLGMNLLPSNNMAARGLGPLPAEANNTNFLLLGTNMLPFQGSPTTSNYPVAIEVNFAVADTDTLSNSNALSRSNVILRNAGLYSFRIPLPRPQVSQ